MQELLISYLDDDDLIAGKKPMVLSYCNPSCIIIPPSVQSTIIASGKEQLYSLENGFVSKKNSFLCFYCFHVIKTSLILKTVFLFHFYAWYFEPVGILSAFLVIVNDSPHCFAFIQCQIQQLSRLSSD